MEGLVSLEEERNGDILILRLKGRLDALSTPETEKKVFNYINHGQHKLLLDFSGVDYISSAGMRMLLATTKKLKPVAGQLVLCSITTNVMDVFKISGFDHILALTESEEEALRKLNAYTSKPN
jgi:anti-anti-sigma factor